MDSTQSTKQKDIVRAWHHIDVKDKTLGRVASVIAQLLIGKSKAYFVRNMDTGDFVVVTNASFVKVSGKKATEKTYFRHSMYPGGLHAETFDKLQKRRPEEVIRQAVKGMLPQNKLRDRMLKRLLVFAGENHTYQAKFAKIQ